MLSLIASVHGSIRLHFTRFDGVYLHFNRNHCTLWRRWITVVRRIASARGTSTYKCANKIWFYHNHNVQHLFFFYMPLDSQKICNLILLCERLLLNILIGLVNWLWLVIIDDASDAAD